jgi:hypothetical protein
VTPNDKPGAARGGWVEKGRFVVEITLSGSKCDFLLLDILGIGPKKGVLPADNLTAPPNSIFF